MIVGQYIKGYSMRTIGALSSISREAENYLPKVLPSNWYEIQAPPEMGFCYGRTDGLRVIISWEEERDNRLWLHASLSRQSRVPSYQDMCDVKELFIGRKKKAIQVFPSEDEHVNIHPNVLHLWHCLTEDVLPDFRKNGAI